MKIKDKIKQIDGDICVAIGSGSSFLYIGPASEFMDHIEKLDQYEKGIISRSIENIETEIKHSTVRCEKLKNLPFYAMLTGAKYCTELTKTIEPVVQQFIRKQQNIKVDLECALKKRKKDLKDYASIETREVKSVKSAGYVGDNEPQRLNIVIEGDEVGRFWFRKDYVKWLNGKWSESKRKEDEDDE